MGVIYLNGIAYGKGSGGGGGGSTSNYNELTNKPSINGVTLDGNKTSEDLGLNASSLADGSTIVVDQNGKLTIGEVSNDDIASLFS